MRQPEELSYASIHTVEPELGLHHAFFVHKLASLSIDAVREYGPLVDHATDQRYEHLDDIENLAWITLHDTMYVSREARRTHNHYVIAPAIKNKSSYVFTSAQELVKAGVIPTFTASWMRKLMLVDRPSPPLPAARDDVFRSVARFLPPLELEQYAKIALDSMPLLNVYYEDPAWRVGKGTDTVVSPRLHDQS